MRKKTITQANSNERVKWRKTNKNCTNKKHHAAALIKKDDSKSQEKYALDDIQTTGINKIYYRLPVQADYSTVLTYYNLINMQADDKIKNCTQMSKNSHHLEK